MRKYDTHQDNAEHFLIHYDEKFKNKNLAEQSIVTMRNISDTLYWVEKSTRNARGLNMRMEDAASFKNQGWNSQCCCTLIWENAMEL